jgi:hypothetical protein
MWQTHTITMSSDESPSKFYKLPIKGMVYLVDPETAIAYLYDSVAPVAVGSIHWINSTQVPELTLFGHEKVDG